MTVEKLRPIVFYVWTLLISCRQPLIQLLAIFLLAVVTGCTSDNVLSTVVERQIKANVPPEYVHDKENIVVVTVGTASPIPGE